MHNHGTGSSMSLKDFLMNTVKPFRWHIGGLVWVIIVWALDTSLRPYILKIILDKLSICSQTETFAILGPWVCVYMGMMLFAVANYRLYDYIRLRLLPGLRQKIINDITSPMLEQSFSYYQDNFAGSLSNKINDIAYGMRELVEIVIDRFFGHALLFMMASLVAYTVHPLFGGLLLSWILLFIVCAYIASKKAHALADRVSEVNSMITGRIVDVLSNMSIVRLCTGQWFERKNLFSWTEEYVKYDQKLYWYLFKVWFLQAISFIIISALSLFFLLRGYEQGLVSVGDFVLILTLIVSVVDCMWNISKDFSQFAEQLGKVTQGLRVTTAPILIQDAPNATLLKVDTGTIRFEKVLFHYKDQEPIFSNKNITIPGGQKVGLVGYSGSGKSTFVNLILRLYDLQSGRILIDGNDIAQVTQDSLRSAISMIPQDPTLFHRNLIDNIRYGKFDATEAEVVQAAKKAYAHDFIMELPQGYDTLVGERGLKLSGGQRQRIAIARAILKNAPILLLDEATSALDSITETFIQHSLMELMKGKTTLVIAHRLSTLLNMDRILVFNKGVIVEDGTHEELLKNRKNYAELWNAQVGGFLPEA